MVDKEKLRRYAALNACAGGVSAGLLVYVVRKWMLLPDIQRDNATSYILLTVGAVLALVSLWYVFLAIVMRFAYKPGVSADAAMCLKVLRYGGEAQELALVWHEGSLCITEYRGSEK